MNWWAMAMLVIGAVVIVATSIPAALMALWRRQEQRDGLR
jgi:hypothetical protein